MTHDGNKASGTGHTVTPYRARRNAVGGNAFCMQALSAVEVLRPPRPPERRTPACAA